MFQCLEAEKYLTYGRTTSLRGYQKHCARSPGMIKDFIYHGRN